MLVGCGGHLAIRKCPLLTLPRVGSHESLAWGDKLRQVAIVVVRILGSVHDARYIVLQGQLAQLLLARAVVSCGLL